MKKHTSKTDVKTIIRKIIDDAMTRIFDVTKDNGYKVAINRSWNTLD